MDVYEEDIDGKGQKKGKKEVSSALSGAVTDFPTSSFRSNLFHFGILVLT